MIINELLKIKYETQKRLNKAAQSSLKKYIENTHKNVIEAEAKYGIKFKYGQLKAEQSHTEDNT
ncbi:MAG TPA: hypothetical protein VJL89_13620 [Thermodesulfovibrionia bacterium]|nr:hypothetical protein [Thermodesulfovibrionia bacterium]